MTYHTMSGRSTTELRLVVWLLLLALCLSLFWCWVGGWYYIFVVVLVVDVTWGESVCSSCDFFLFIIVFLL